MRRWQAGGPGKLRCRPRTLCLNIRFPLGPHRAKDYRASPPTCSQQTQSYMTENYNVCVCVCVCVCDMGPSREPADLLAKSDSTGDVAQCWDKCGAGRGGDVDVSGDGGLAARAAWLTAARALACSRSRSAWSRSCSASRTCVCVFACVYVYACVYSNIYIYIYTYIYIYIYRERERER